MKNRAVLFAVIVFAATLAVGQKPKSSNSTTAKTGNTVCGEANTQMEINQCFDDEYKKADAKLNALYSELLQKRDAATVNRLQSVQRIWIKYRDAHCEAAAALYAGGSIQPSIRSECLDRVTRFRIDEMEHAYSTETNPQP